MKKNFIKFVLVILVFAGGEISCHKSMELPQNDLTGNWQSTQVDSLYHFVVPESPDTLVSCEYQDSRLDLREDGSFRMISSGDTTVGSWEQFVSDSLRFKVEDVQGKIQTLYPLKIEYVDQDELTLVSFGGFLSFTQYPCDTAMSVITDTRYEAKVYYRRSQN